MSTAAVEAWRDEIRAKREAEEAQWAELNAAVQAAIYQLGAGQRAEAEDSARVALDIEYDLTGNCDTTARLCEALGLSIEEPEEADDG